MFKNILIIKWGALGDILAGTIAMVALRKKFPEAKITFLTNAIGTEVVPPGSLVDATLNLDDLLRQHGQLGLIFFLRKQRFDLGVNLKFYSDYAAILSILCAQKSAGGGPNHFRFFYSYPTRDPITVKGRQEYNYIAQHAETLGAKSENLESFLFIAPQDRAFADKFLSESGIGSAPFLLMAPSASNVCKCWPIENFIELCKKFLAEFPMAKIVLSVMPQETHLMKIIAETLPQIAVHPPTTIGQIGAIAERAKLVLCNASGMMNVAHAVKVPLVCVNTTHDWILNSATEIFINAFDKNENGEEITPVSEERALELIRTIPVESVWQSVKKLWRIYGT